MDDLGRRGKVRILQMTSRGQIQGMEASQTDPSVGNLGDLVLPGQVPGSKQRTLQSTESISEHK